MRPFFLALVLAALAAPCARAADPGSGLKDPESILQALRSTDTAQCQTALVAIAALPGYPQSAQDLLPALLWMAHGDDPDLVAAAKLQAQALGWPKTYNLEAVHRLAVREDNVFRMMALDMLVRLAWRDPEAMALLLEVNRTHAHGTGVMIRAFASSLREVECPTDPEMDDWNTRMVPFRQRMLNALHDGGAKMRPMAEALLRCAQVDPEVAAEAQALLDSTAAAELGQPAPSPAPSPVPLAVPGLRLGVGGR
ncbi:MAG TPA: hypothetical protein VNZ54_07995 [bacterium]|jgi:hypothetical protein|nr:hypothetical protein [bacterium]